MKQKNKLILEKKTKKSEYYYWLLFTLIFLDFSYR